MERFTDSQTWYVCFQPSGARRWWNLFLNTPFQHVMLLTEVEGGVLCINSLAHAFAVKIYPNKIEELISGIVLSRTVHYSMIYEKMPLMPLTCVAIACRILGIRKRIMTPKGLYDELIKSGCNVIIPHNPCGNVRVML
jgi:hypothetical protein